MVHASRKSVRAESRSLAEHKECIENAGRTRECGSACPSMWRESNKKDTHPGQWGAHRSLLVSQTQSAQRNFPNQWHDLLRLPRPCPYHAHHGRLPSLLLVVRSQPRSALLLSFCNYFTWYLQKETTLCKLVVKSSSRTFRFYLVGPNY